MHARPLLAVIAAIAVMAAVRPATAQDCPCDCYFSSDCEPGNFCNWGTLSQEDTCFWRTPKPQGSPGAGCDEVFNDWGQCDGICDPSSAESGFTTEGIDNLTTGLTLWSSALITSARRGGGTPDADAVEVIRGIPYHEARMVDGMWRVTIEVLMLTLGSDVLTFPDSEFFRSEDAVIKDLSRDPALVRLGELALQALAAEIEVAGSGRPFIDEIVSQGLMARVDPVLLDRICREEPSEAECLYTRLSDMGQAIGRGGRDDLAVGLGGGCQEPQCIQDITSDLVVNINDLLYLLGQWGGPYEPWIRGDTNGDGMIDSADLLDVLGMWGPCP